MLPGDEKEPWMGKEPPVSAQCPGEQGIPLTPGVWGSQVKLCFLLKCGTKSVQEEQAQCSFAHRFYLCIRCKSKLSLVLNNLQNPECFGVL